MVDSREDKGNLLASVLLSLPRHHVWCSFGSIGYVKSKYLQETFIAGIKPEYVIPDPFCSKPKQRV